MNEIKSSKKTGVLLVNLGSPDSPSVPDVRRYLKEFLNDPFVINIPKLLRLFLVNVLILNTRPKKSAHAYSKIWMKEGSPLIFHSKNLTEKVRDKLQMAVELGMRYGTPSIESALKKLLGQGVEKVVLLPLYPHYSYAASETAIVLFEKLMSELAPGTAYEVIEDYWDNSTFLDALADSIRPVLEEKKPDVLLLTYHGIPKRQVFQTRNQRNYHSQCLLTSRKVRERLGLPVEKVKSSFQSRLGPVKWIRPFTDFVLRDFPKHGVKKIVVASPAFSADCLETLEEIKLRYDELFRQNGGTEFHYVPCLNSSDAFVNSIGKILEPHL